MLVRVFFTFTFVTMVYGCAPVDKAFFLINEVKSIKPTYGTNNPDGDAPGPWDEDKDEDPNT